MHFCDQLFYNSRRFTFGETQNATRGAFMCWDQNHSLITLSFSLEGLPVNHIICANQPVIFVTQLKRIVVYAAQHTAIYFHNKLSWFLLSNKAFEVNCIVTNPVVQRIKKKSSRTKCGNEIIILAFCFKDGAYYCYCAHVLRISRYSDF